MKFHAATIGKAILLGVTLLSVLSCRSLTEYQPPQVTADGKKLLKAPVGPDAVTFDELIIHIPHQERDLLDQLWREVDEQVLPAEVRNELYGNGFRAGIIGASIPESLSRLMAIKGRGLRKTVEEKVSLEKKHAAPLTLSKIETLEEGNVLFIQTRDQAVDRMPVLSKEKDFLTGETYPDAMTSLSVAVKPISDGSVNFELTPFLTFGETQLVSRYRHGQLIRTTEQPTKTFDHLRCDLPLRPGQFLIIGPSDSGANGLGHYFFTQGIGDFDQKIVVIRLLFTQHDQLFHRFPGFQEIYDELPAEIKETGGADSGFLPDENAPQKTERTGFLDSLTGRKKTEREDSPSDPEDEFDDETPEGDSSSDEVRETEINPDFPDDLPNGEDLPLDDETIPPKKKGIADWLKIFPSKKAPSEEEEF